MANWILKTEPSTYSFDDLARAGKAVWDGVSNPVAVRNIRAMKTGDQLMIYHTGDEKQVVGLAEVVSEPYDDPKDKGGRLAVVDIKAGKRVAKPVTLAAIKADPAFKDLALVRQGRLSVVSVPADLWERMLKMSR